jgi:hypothetical protein
VLGVKMVEKGYRALKEEHLHDYNARKANLDAAEKALWNEVSIWDKLPFHTIFILVN